MRLRSWVISDRGGRAANEDACGYLLSQRLGCWVVSDGAGGHENGAVASELAVRTILRTFELAPELSPDYLKRLLHTANEALVAQRHEPARGTGMRATAAMLIVDPVSKRALWAHAGDTRIYFLRDARVVAYTRDHSVVQGLADAGYITQDRVRSHPNRSTLVTALGEQYDFAPAVLTRELAVRPNDAFLICTDGAWEHVLERQIEDCLASAASPEEWLRKLEASLLQVAPKGHDNYSLLGIWLEEDDPTASSPDEEVTVMRLS